MSNTNVSTPYIARARKVLQYEQRNNHQDKLVQGGLELFASRWAEEFSTARKEAGLDLRPLHRFMEHLEGYRRQDPLQRSTNVRAALSILDEMEQDGAQKQGAPAPAAQMSTATVARPQKSNGADRASAAAKISASGVPVPARSAPDLKKTAQKISLFSIF